MSESGETPAQRCATMYAVQSNRCRVTSFQLIGLPREPFEILSALPDERLEELNARRVIAKTKPGYPCRVSLVDAEVGEELFLLPFEHQPASSPYKACGPIYIRTLAVQARLTPGTIPESVSSRLISVRAYDRENMMCGAIVCAGTDCGSTIDRMFADPAVAYIHLHNANRGCFSCRVERALRTP